MSGYLESSTVPAVSSNELSLTCNFSIETSPIGVYLRKEKCVLDFPAYIIYIS